MKKILALILAVIMMMGVMVACGSGDASEKEPADTNNAQTEDVVTIRLGHSNEPSDDAWCHHFALVFERLVEEYSEGSIVVDIYPSSQLGDEAEMYGGCGTGTIDMALGATTNYVSYAPFIAFSTLPYMFESIDQARDFFIDNIDWVQEQSVAQANSRVMGVLITSTRELTTKEPVYTLDDMKGMKVRTPSTATMIRCYEAWGASPVVVGWNETYTALQQGVADAQDNPIYVLIDNSLAEVQDYVVENGYLMNANMFLMSEDFYQSLTDEQKEIVDKAAADTVVECNAYCDERMANTRAEVEALGVTFCGVPSDLDKWVELAQSTWSEAYADIGNGDAALGEEIVNYVIDYKANY